MATTRSFSNMLNDYLPNEMLKEEFVKRDYVLQNIEKRDDWKGGPLIVPFKGAGASSIAYGSLTASDNIAEDQTVRGEISGPVEVWGSLIFNHRDLMEHGKISEQNLLKILPDSIEDFLTYMKSVVSTNLLIGSHFATLTADGDVSGNMTVDRPDRFVIGQQVYVDDSDSNADDGYVKTINMETKVINLVTTRGGATPVDLSGYAVSAGAKVYHPGSQASAFSSLRSTLLSAANGGDSTLYGVTKTAWPYTQAIQIDASTATSDNLMEKIFLAIVETRKFGKGSPSEAIMSLTNLAHCMKIVESSKGAFNVVAGSQKASQYGWMELTVGSPTKGGLKLVGVQEADDDVIFLVDWRALSFHSNGFFQKRKSPDGNEYFEVRATTGYAYIVDICLFGELVLKRPSYCGVMHSIDI